MTQETINDVFEVDGITYVHPDARPPIESWDAAFNARPIFEVIDDLEDFDESMDVFHITPQSFVWFGPPTTKGLMDD